MAGKSHNRLPQNRQPRAVKKNRGNPHPKPPPLEHQFKPGVSGNPGGRPKALSEAYRDMLARVDESDAQKRTHAELIADALKKQALKGDVAAAKEIRAGTEGDTLNLEGAVMVRIDR